VNYEFWIGSSIECVFFQFTYYGNII